MVDNISGVGPQGITPDNSTSKKIGVTPKEGERSFKEILEDSISKVNQFQQEADLSLEKYYRGEATEDEVMIAFRKAQIAFEALMQIRNKLVDAFEEIQRMRI